MTNILTKLDRRFLAAKTCGLGISSRWRSVVVTAAFALFGGSALAEQAGVNLGSANQEQINQAAYQLIIPGWLELAEQVFVISTCVSELGLIVKESSGLV